VGVEPMKNVLNYLLPPIFCGQNPAKPKTNASGAAQDQDRIEAALGLWPVSWVSSETSKIDNQPIDKWIDKHKALLFPLLQHTNLMHPT
jgi:hypothetical protein